MAVGFVGVDIRVPADPFNTDEFVSSCINPETCRVEWIFFWNTEFSITTMDALSKPYAVLWDPYEY